MVAAGGYGLAGQAMEASATAATVGMAGMVVLGGVW